MPKLRNFKDAADIKDQDIRDALTALTDDGAIRHAEEEFSAENTVREAMTAWTKLCQVVKDISDILAGTVDGDFHQKMASFRRNLRKWDALVTPKPGTKDPDGLEDSNLPTECYQRLDNEDAITPEFLLSILDDRKKMLCVDYMEAVDEEKSLQEVSDSHYKYRQTLQDKGEYFRTRLERLETALKASDHFFQKSSPQFKAMKDSLAEATKTLRILKRRNYTSVNGADNEKLNEILQKQLQDVLEKTNGYLVYKQNGPTGFFGESRVKAAKVIRNQIRGLMKEYKMAPTKSESQIIAGAEDNIQDIFRGDKSFIIGGYLAPQGGRNFGQYKRFADAFDESEYHVLVGSRLDLVFDQLKNPDENIGLYPKILNSVGNFSDPELVPDADLFTECEGLSYTVKNMIDRVAAQKEFNLDVALYARISDKLMNGMNPDYIQNDEIIRDNIKSAKALAVTGKLYEDFLPYREMTEKIQDVKFVKGQKFTAEQINIGKRATNVEEQNRLLAYGFVKYISQHKGMGAVLHIARKNLAKNSNWTWESMVANMRTQDKYKDAFEDLEQYFTEQVNGKKVTGHVLRHYNDIMNTVLPETFDKVLKVDKTQRMEKNMNPAAKVNEPKKKPLQMH